jgi:predicted transcriptional regulator|tara:strand:+ start:535 stop:921 length:387 start_codon:yes stop_codon:yes gene_type:complete
MKPQLTDAELAVMNLLWDNEQLTARQVREALYPDATKAQHGTVQKLLQRLEEKGCVKRNDTPGINLFSSALSREAYGGTQLESLATRLTSGSVAPLITHLVENNKISREEIERLRTILAGYEEEAKKA